VLELWHEWNSVHSFKVRVVLAEKGLAWRGHPLELLRLDHLRPEYLRLHPSGVVPTLVHEGRALGESSVIVQYLEEIRPRPALLPQEPYARARARLWLKYFDEVVHPAVRAASFPLLYRPYLRQCPPQELEDRIAAHPDAARARAFLDAARQPLDRAALGAALTRFTEIIGRIDTALAEAEWLGGERFGMADAALAAFAERVDHLGLQLLWRDAPRAEAWRARILARPSVRAAAAPPQHRLPAPAEELRREALACLAAPGPA
jgi:glutathione S-transferase